MLIGECVSRMTHAVEEFGGSVSSYMGDGIAAFFGIPTAHEDDPERAARAALRILTELGTYAEEVATAWGITDFNARVGINTGPTAVGLVGAADPQAVSLGDTNNVAARLQGVAEPGTIAVGQATAQCLVNRFTLEPLGEVSVKGRVQPVEAWKLVGIRSDHSEDAQTPLVGRGVELQRLQSTVDELTSGRGQILFLLGDSGIGKTRLLTELRTIASDRVTWLEGRCYSYGTKLLYGPFIQMLRSWVGIDEGEPELSVRTKLRAKLGLLPMAEVQDVLPYLARLLSVRLDPESDERLRTLAPDTLAAEIRRAYKHWLVSIARERPVVVAIEDLHWADPPTCDLAEELLDLVDLTPLLVAATSRVDPATEGWRLRVRALSDHVHRTLELPLGPLSEEDAAKLLAALPQSRDLSASELAQIVAGAEGNPLYLEELCAAFVEGSGRRGLTWAPTMAGARVLTPTLESLLLARIDRLPRGARRLAQTAAVIGRSFPFASWSASPRPTTSRATSLPCCAPTSSARSGGTLIPSTRSVMACCARRRSRRSRRCAGGSSTGPSAQRSSASTQRASRTTSRSSPTTSGEATTCRWASSTSSGRASAPPSWTRCSAQVSSGSAGCSSRSGWTTRRPGSGCAPGSPRSPRARATGRPASERG